MNRRRALSALAAAGALLLTPTAVACSSNEAADTGVEVETPDVPDCDAEDRRRNEQPDCGRMVNGKFVQWSWVKAGKTKPPAGWSSSSETGASSGSAATKAPKPRRSRRS